jgi:farnesyl diphosphate synthase
MSELLSDCLGRIASDVDSGFDALLPVPQDSRAPLVEAMRYAVIGAGKRIRPLLLTATAEMYGANREAAVQASLSIEAIHGYSLIHDDLPCMDDDDIRHGKPAVHKVFGEATAVLAGDALHALAFELLADPGTLNSAMVRAELVLALGQAAGLNGMAGGQMMDIAAEHEALDLAAVTRLQQLKTGALLGAAVEMGAILADVPTGNRTHLRSYASDIGLAFQISDDLLDFEGDEHVAGKALRKDAGKGKQTFVSLLGADLARAHAHSLVEQAIGHLKQHGDEADLLRALARFVVERDH